MILSFIFKCAVKIQKSFNNEKRQIDVKEKCVI